MFNDKTPINTDGAECPYCGHVHDMCESDHSDGHTDTIECYSCHKEFQFEVCVKIDWRSKPIKCEEHQYDKYAWSPWSLDRDHAWHPKPIPAGQHSRLRACMNCDDGNQLETEIIERCIARTEHQWGDWSQWYKTSKISSYSENSWRVKYCKFHGNLSHTQAKDFTDEEIKKMKEAGDYYVK